MATRQNSTNIDWENYDGNGMCPDCDLCRDCGHAHEIGKTHTCHLHRREEVRFVERDGVTYSEPVRAVIDLTGESLTRQAFRDLFSEISGYPNFPNFPPQFVTPVHDSVVYKGTIDQLQAVMRATNLKAIAAAPLPIDFEVGVTWDSLPDDVKLK